MTKHAQLPDGTTLEFPDETPDAVMDRTVRSHLAQMRNDATPDFSEVRSRVVTTASSKGPLAPSTMAAGAPLPPSLSQTNAKNRAYQSSPQAEIDRQRFEASQAEAKRRDFQSLPAAARFAIGAGSRVAGTARGAEQLYAQAADVVAPRQQTVAGLVSGAPNSRYSDAMRSETRARSDDQYMQGDVSASLGGAAGDIALLATPGGTLGKTLGAGWKGALATNVAMGAGYAGLQPVVEDESRAENTAYGGAFGAGAHGLAAGVGAAGRNAMGAIAPEIRQLAQRANSLGIPLHASQVSQSLPVKVAASAGKYLPFSGYAKAASRQQTAVNRAVGNTFGADSPKLTDEVMETARAKMSSQFEDIFNRNVVPLGEQGTKQLVAIERQASRRLTNSQSQVLRNQLEDILANVDDGVLTGHKYQAVRTSLKKAEDDTKLGLAVRELRVALDNIAADSVGATDAATLKTLRSSWANYKTTKDALKQVSGAAGDVRPAALWPLIRNGSTKEMRELARIGQTLLKDPIADSGTAQRSLIYNLLMSGGSIANPALIPLIAKAAAGGATLGRAANSNTLARLLTRESRGVRTSKLGQLMLRSSPAIGPATGAEWNRREREDGSDR